MNYRMRQWAEKVWRRDDWTCQNCGATIVHITGIAVGGADL
jgi:5-methylcytosine-specific restriction endonuclease McrA